MPQKTLTFAMPQKKQIFRARVGLTKSKGFVAPVYSTKSRKGFQKRGVEDNIQVKIERNLHTIIIVKKQYNPHTVVSKKFGSWAYNTRCNLMQIEVGNQKYLVKGCKDVVKTSVGLLIIRSKSRIS